MAQKPIDGGSYFQGEDGTLIRLEEEQLLLDPKTRELKRPTPPRPKAEQPTAPIAKK